MYEPFTLNDISLYYISIISTIVNTASYLISIHENIGTKIGSALFLISLGFWILYSLVRSFLFLLSSTSSVNSLEIALDDHEDFIKKDK